MSYYPEDPDPNRSMLILVGIVGLCILALLLA